MLLAQRTLFENELLTVQDLLRVTIFDLDPEWFSRTMVSLIPHKRIVRLHIQLDPHQGARDRHYVSFEFETWKFVDLVQNSFTHLRVVDDLADLLGVHVVEMVPLKLCFLFDFACYILQVHHLSELSQRCH